MANVNERSAIVVRIGANKKVHSRLCDFGPWLEILRERIPEGPLKIKATDVWKLVGFDGPETINKLTKVHHAHMRAAMVGLGFEKRDNGLRFRDGEKKAAYLRGDAEEAKEWSPDRREPAYDYGSIF